MSLEIEYRNRNPKGHWFDDGTMRFFKSRIGVCKLVGKVWLFVSSEKGLYGKRCYSIRRMDEAGDISTVGDFMEHETRSQALAALKRAAKAEVETSNGE